MTTDNRTNEPTETQVEAAAKALYEVRPNGDIEWDSAEFDEWMERGDYLTKARAALEAAARAAHGAAVVPSSGVDEDKLAEVIRKLRFYTSDCWSGGIDCTESVGEHADDIARAVIASRAEWLKGQGR